MWERGYRRLRLLQRLQHRIRARHVELTRLLDIELLDHAVLDQHRIALRAHAEAALAQIQLQPNRLGEIAAAVGQHHDLLAAILVLAPGAHHKGVVDRYAGDRVNALPLQIGRLFDIARQVALRAGRGEGARHREQRYLLAAEKLVGADLLGAFRAEVFQRRRWDLLANLDGHGILPPN